ncbi:MAG TPA: S8 family peptidase, partial [Allosphingosinicella sp.]|nr:S8 family peptidase [Allosphingosinicella sp.]
PAAVAVAVAAAVGVNYNDSEYARSGASSHASIAAYNRGATGRGVKIAIVDSGINPNLPEFAGRIDPASRDVAASRGISDTEGHGTAVAAVAAAARDGVGMMGVAFDSTIMSFNTSDPTDCSEEDGCQHSSADIVRAIDLARENGAKVINISLGGGDPSISVNNAIVRAAASGILVVMSAGNSGKEATGANPEAFALSASSAGNVIIAGSMDSGRLLADSSNRAGTGAAVYLTAIGVRVRAPNHLGESYLWSGTSFSAPVISGAAALLAGAFPHLTGQQIVQILLGSADDAGAPGTDGVFGRGILNIDRAFQPQGSLSLPGGQAVDVAAGSSQGSTAMGDARTALGGMVVLDGFSRAYTMTLNSALQRAEQDRPLGRAFQPGLRTATAGARGVAVSITVDRRLTGQPQVGFAQLGLTYEDGRKARLVSGIAISRLNPRLSVALGLAESGKTLERRLSGHYRDAFLVAQDPMSRMGFQGDSAGALGVRHRLGRIGLTATAERGEVLQPGFDRSIVQPRYGLFSIAADRRLGRARLSLGASRLDEESTLFGARFSPLIGVSGGTSWFADAGATFALGRGWDASLGYRLGWSAVTAAAGLARGGRLASDAWSVDLGRTGTLRPGDRFALRLMQPLRVRSGGFDLNVPVSYSYDTLSAGYESRFFNLAPTGREIDLEAAYGIDLLSGAGHLSGNVFARRHPGNVAEMDSDLGAAIRFTLGF